MAEINGLSKIDNRVISINNNRKATETSAGFSSYLGEPKSLDDIFGQAAKKYNVPENLLKAIGKAESSFNAKAVSRSGAQGVMQLMPATAKELGVTDSFDPEQNIMGGAKYISGLLKKYKGDTKLALAAYNAGSGNVKKYGGIPPFEETQNYVKKVMKFSGQQLEGEIAAAEKRKQGPTEQVAIASLPATTTTVVQNNLAYLYANSEDSLISENGYLDQLFSYEDYMKFVDLFLKEDKEENDDEDKSVYSTREINYNSVMKLLRNQNTI